MGAVIKATATVVDPSIRSSIAMAAAAGTECIRAGKISVDDVDVVINVGVYRDDNMLEPAMAALIEKAIGVGLDYVKHPQRKAAFGFDIMNGGCGILNAIQVAGALLATGSARHVLLVASEGHPSQKDVVGFPYLAGGTAMLLAAGDRPERGFGRLAVSDDASGSSGVEGVISRTDGRFCVTVVRDADYADRALELAVRTAEAYIQRESIDRARTLLITSQISNDFGEELARRLGFGETAVVAGDAGGDRHSSALTFAYHHACETGLLSGGGAAKYDHVLFIGAAAGPMAACASYRL